MYTNHSVQTTLHAFFCLQTEVQRVCIHASTVLYELPFSFTVIHNLSVVGRVSDVMPCACVFAEDARQKQEGVLIHCLAGISRSVTITLAYIMHSLNLDLNEAFECVKRKRANISPNFNFMGQLQDFEKSLESQRNCTCQCPKRNSSFFGAAPPPVAPDVTDSSKVEAASPLKGVGGGVVCACACHSLKSYFTSPGSSYHSSGSSAVSVTSSSGNTSSPQFSYEVPPSPT